MGFLFLQQHHLIRFKSTCNTDYYTKLAHENAIEWQSTESSITISLNQTTSIDDLEKVLDVFSIKINPKSSIDEQIPADHKRQTTFLQQAVFHEHYQKQMPSIH